MLYDHRKKSPNKVACKIITVSDTRTEETDKSGKKIKQLLEQAGHEIIEYEIVTDEKLLIQTSVQSAIHNPDIDAVLLNGGTGLAKRDITIEVVQPLLEKEITGFGELFRFLSYRDDIGSAAILSRAAAGTSEETAVFAMPGSTGAVTLAMEKLILPELGHIIMELQK
ncbi:MogA/MoaB family molybdenum cofactor biosynthesis protein [Jeotgalibacillus proteolyticus]|uniref:Molybdenum cofactor biosynthesis protein B n=1 Tax=Jeotgalibacillus proteolyticus TaxID=2082395 RepID=A0A2S5GCM9_9BACL|nr:MogA/MoaB family molybdenum cofactor biosynthesis protein [Jeotgalibacillus proteolyticus]PPA70708.1 molybdenum cofactor biosynthesis protein [Jeotgalibacillus proteolyticus]